jgi:26S proteasome regulatory subunit T5
MVTNFTSFSLRFVDELDAIGAKRQDSELSGDREVQRTMLELLNQLDGFSSDDRVKVIAATNRPDILDPALLRSGRLDRKVELPHPNEGTNILLSFYKTKKNFNLTTIESRVKILQIHSRKMNINRSGSILLNINLLFLIII